MSAWKPRASAIGYHFQCTQRAVLDKLAFEAQLVADHVASPNADLGTVIHFTLQDGIRAQFPGPAIDYMYTPEELANAARLGVFKNDTSAVIATARQVATKAARLLPKTPDGKPWLAEPAFENDYLTGHIDFLSQDKEILVDLKTTVNFPEGGRMLPEHLIQLTAYHLLSGCRTGYILYASSTSPDWAFLSAPVDFSDPFVADLAQQVKEFAISCMQPGMKGMPQLGECKYCRHTPTCRDKLIPHSTFANPRTASPLMPVMGTGAVL